MSTKTWDEFYKVTSPDIVRFLQTYHEQYIKLVQSLKPKNIIEIGVGCGATMAKFVELQYNVVGIDNNPDVIETCHKTLEGIDLKCEVVECDAFGLDIGFLGMEPSETVCTSQGTMEHFSDNDIVRLVGAQMISAGHVCFSVPTINYPAQDVGDERLMHEEDWRTILSGFEIVTSIQYGGADNNHQLAFALRS